MRWIWVCAALICVACGGIANQPVKALVAPTYAHTNAIEFLDEIPASIAGFGYIDFGKPVRTWIQDFLAFNRAIEAILNDMTEAAQRRLGLSLNTVTSIGMVIVPPAHWVFVIPTDPKARPAFAASSQLPHGFDLEDNWVWMPMGNFAAIGTLDAVTQLVNLRAHEPRITQSRAAFLRWTFQQPTGNLFFAFETSMRMRSRAGGAYDEAIPFSVGCSVEACRARVKASAPVLRWLRTQLNFTRGRVHAALATLPDTPVYRLARLYADTALRNLKAAFLPNLFTLDFAFRPLQWPTRTPTPALAQRVAAPTELAVAQIALGSTLVDNLFAIIDIMATPIDRAAFTRELYAHVPANLPMGATSATLSVGANGEAIVSMSNDAPDGFAPGTAAKIPWLTTQPTPWGVALALANRDHLKQASAPNPELEAHLTSQRNDWFRGAIDVNHAPPALAKILWPWLRSISAQLNDEAFALTLVAAPGKAPVIKQILTSSLAEVIAEAKPAYDQRAKGTWEQEAEAIGAYRSAQFLATTLVPSVQGDTLRIVRTLRASETQVYRYLMPLLAGLLLLAGDEMLTELTTYLDAFAAAAPPIEPPDHPSAMPHGAEKPPAPDKGKTRPPRRAPLP